MQSRIVAMPASLAGAAVRRSGRLASSGALAALDVLLRSKFAEQAADKIIDSPATERIVGRVIESRLVDEAVERLLESEDLWILVDEIARSPSVTEAISHQSLGLADQFAEVVRDRSGRADDRLERAVRGLFKRNGNGQPQPSEQRQADAQGPT